MVYVSHLPEMQEQELLPMLLTWFGMCWVGNPFILGVKVLYQDSGSNHGEVCTGTAALRFPTVELAKHFIKLFHGLEVYYQQYVVQGLVTREEMRSDHPLPKIGWYQTNINATICMPNKTRNVSWQVTFPLSSPPVRYRIQERRESLLWQCAMPCYDFELWCHDAKWLINPNTGVKLDEMRVHNRAFGCYVKHADISFWEAVGHREGSSNGRKIWPESDCLVGGLWSNHEEYSTAWESTEFVDADDEAHRRPVQQYR